MAFLIYSGFFSFYFWLRYCPTGNTLRYRPISLALNTGSRVALSPVAIRALGYAIALRAIRSAIALFRLRSIRALVSPYFAYAQYGLLYRPIAGRRYGLFVTPGLRFAHPGLYSGAPSGR